MKYQSFAQSTVKSIIVDSHNKNNEQMKQTEANNKEESSNKDGCQLASSANATLIVCENHNNKQCYQDKKKMANGKLNLQCITKRAA